MSDCPHIHIQDSGLQAFRDIIREETDGGRDIVRFLKGAANREYSNYEPHHELKAAEILAKYGFEEAAELVRRHKSSRPRRSASSGGSRVPLDSVPNQAGGPNPDPAIDPGLNEFVQFIRDETDNGRTIVRNLIHAMETHEDPYKPHHNLAAAKQLIDNGFPITGDLICYPDCTHHTAPADGAAVSGSSAHPERSGAESKDEEEFVPDPGWVETLHEIKRMEDEGIIPVVEYDPFNPNSRMTGTEEQIAPYAAEEAAKFRAELDLQAERRAKWPEIEERRRKKLAQIYPSHSDDTPSDSDPPDP